MPLVSVITRTNSRTVLLSRALESLLDQKSKDFEWIVVNDGTEDEGVCQIVERASSLLKYTKLVHTAKRNNGMEAASNFGLSQVSSELVTFLDDDDTWEPDFLAETTDFLNRYPELVGVCTQTNVVEEIGDPPERVFSYVMNADLKALHLADMMIFNHLTTNSLIYRFAIHEEIGPYREDLPVMGDWEFGLRLLSRRDIGVIPKPLANYHRRTDRVASSDAMANTVIAHQGTHAQTDARLRNEFIRKGLEGDPSAAQIGMMMANARILLRTNQLTAPRLLALEEAYGLEVRTIRERLDHLERLVSERTSLSVRAKQLLGRWFQKP